MKIIKDKSFYKLLITIALPISLQNLISTALSMADTIMLGIADDTSVLLSASNLANQPLFVMQLFVFGLAGAGCVLSSQYWGKKNIEAIRRVISIVVKIALFVSLIVQTLILCFPEGVMRIYSQNEAIVAAGVEYLRIVGWGYVLFAFSSSLICSIRSVELVKISVVTNLVSCSMNVVLNWILIFGQFGFPPMGIQGAAIATLISRIADIVIVTVYVFVIDKKLAFRFKHLLSFDLSLFKDTMRHGSPVILNELMWSLGISVQAAILGHITYVSGDPVAANSIAGILQQLATVFIFGFGSAASVIIGKSIGSNEGSLTALKANTLKWIGLGVGIFSCGIILLLKDLTINLYDFSAETKELASGMTVVIAFVSIFSSIATMLIMGVLRGAGDTKFCLATELACLWGVAIPLACILAFALQSPVPIVLAGMKIDEFLKSIVCFIRMRNDNWIKSVTREIEVQQT